jgi:hypothetical protein
MGLKKLLLTGRFTLFCPVGQTGLKRLGVYMPPLFLQILGVLRQKWRISDKKQGVTDQEQRSPDQQQGISDQK